MSSASVASRFGINAFSLGALVVAAFVWGADVFHLSYAQALIVSVPGTALGALGLKVAFRKGERKWFAWTAFGLNFPVTLLGFVWLLAYLVGFRGR